MNLKDYIRSIPDYPKKGILFRDITTLIKNEKAFSETINQIVKILKNYEKEGKIYNIGGVIIEFKLPPHYDFNEYRKTPEELKIYFRENGWKKIVGLQGAGLTNLIWCRKNTKIIEIRSKYTNKLYENLSIQNNLNFLKIQSKPLEKNIKSTSKILKVTGISI